MAIIYRSPGIPYRSTHHNYRGLAFQGTISFRAKILKWTPTVSAKARIQKRQGWPEPDPDQLGEVIDGVFVPYNTFTYTALPGKASIVQPTIKGTTLLVGCRIWRGKKHDLTAGAKIVSAGFLDMKACIQPRFRYSQVTATFDVESIQKHTARVVFYIEGAEFSRQLIAMQARIQRVYRTRMTGHLSVPMPIVAPNNVIVFDYAGAPHTRQLIQMKAKVSR